ncbi:MAG: WG repeat-containing protein [Polyangiaceae bacterium]
MKNGVFFRLTLSLPKKEVAAWKKASVREQLARIPGDHSEHEGGGILGGELSVEGAKTLKAALEELEGMGIELEKKDVGHWEKTSIDGKPHIRIETKGALKRDATVGQLLKYLQKQTNSGEEFVAVESDGKQGRVDVWGYLGGYDAYSTHCFPLLVLGAAVVERQGMGQLVFIGDSELLSESVLVLGRFSADGVELVEHVEPQDVTEEQAAELDAALGEGGSDRIRAAYDEWLAKFIEKKRLRLFAGCAGWLRPDGSWAIEPRFRSAGVFSEGLAAVSERGPFGYGYIDEGGNLVIPQGFFSAGAHKQGRALVRPSTDSMKYGFIDRTGAWIVPAKYARAEDFAEGRALVGDGKLLGFVDLDGNEIVPPKYRHALGFACGLALVADHSKNEAGGFGFIDEQGQVAIPLRLENAGPFHEGFALAARNGNWGFLAPDGKFLFPPRFSQCGYLVDDRAAAMLDGKWGVVDGKGNTVIPFARVNISLVGDWFVSTDGQSCTFYDKSGEELFRIPFSVLRDPGDGFIAVAKSYYGPFGYMDFTGKIAIEPRFKFAAPFEQGAAIVEDENGQWGIIDESGAMTAAFDFPMINSASAGRFSKSGITYVESLNRFGLVDRKGKLIFPTELEMIHGFGNELIWAKYPEEVE